jgi:hypothetical protein
LRGPVPKKPQATKKMQALGSTDPGSWSTIAPLEQVDQDRAPGLETVNPKGCQGD